MEFVFFQIEEAGDDSESSDDESKQTRTGVYVPPKVISAPYGMVIINSNV